MNDKLTYNEINEKVCNNLKKFFDLEEKYSDKSYSILADYANYIEYPQNINLVLLDSLLYPVKIMDEEDSKKYTSHLKKQEDGFWYFGFSLDFYQSEQLNFVKTKSLNVVGIKFLDENIYEIKLLNGSSNKITTEIDLHNFFNIVNKDILENYKEYDRYLKAKKIGF